MKRLVCSILALAALASCGGSEPATTTKTEPPKNDLMAPITAPLQARRKLRQDMRILNHTQHKRGELIESINDHR